MVMPVDFGAHQRVNRSGLVQASNTMRAGALKLRVMTSSRSDLRSVVVRFATEPGSGFPFSSIDFLLPFHVFNHFVQRIKAGTPKLAVTLDPFHLLIQLPQPKLASAHAPD